MTASLPAPSMGPVPSSAVPGAGGLSLEGLSPEWVAAVQAMGGDGTPLVDRSSGMALREVNDLLESAFASDTGWTARKQVAAVRVAARVGIAPADLIAFATTRPRTSGQPHEPMDIMALVQGHLLRLGAAWPEMTLRDALGWALVYPSPRLLPRPDPATPVRPWVDAGLMAGGWRFAGAGFTPDEARQALAAGPVDEDRLRLLAALRGVPLPA